MKTPNSCKKMKDDTRRLVSLLFIFMSAFVFILGLIWTFRGAPSILRHNFLAVLVVPAKFVLTIAGTIFFGLISGELSAPASSRRSRSARRAYRASGTYGSAPHYGYTDSYALQIHQQTMGDALRMHEDAVRAHEEAADSFRRQQWSDQQEDFGRLCSESQSRADDYARSSTYEAQSCANDFAQSSMDYTQSSANDFASSMIFGGGGFGF